MIQLLIRHRHVYIITKTVQLFILDYVLVTLSFIYVKNASPDMYICDSPPGVHEFEVNTVPLP